MRGGGRAEQGRIYHLISRFVAKEWFIEGTHERNVYLSLLADAMEGVSWRCFSFAIMSSHVHLGLIAGEEPLAVWLRPMHTIFAQWMNERRERIGAVFVKGPNFIPVHRSGTAHLLNYIHYNPVRAGVVARPIDSDWTSHRAYLGQTARPPWLAVEDGLERAQFGSGAAFGAWSDTYESSRDDVDAHRVVPRRPGGRPAKARPMEETWRLTQQRVRELVAVTKSSAFGVDSGRRRTDDRGA